MSTATGNKASAKSARKSRIITLRLSPNTLSRFSSDDSPDKSSASIHIDPSPSLPPLESADKSSDSNATPVPPTDNDGTDNNSLAPPKPDSKRKKSGGSIPGRKRAPPTIDPNGPTREKGRPGPKKKPRLPDGTIDRSLDVPAGTTADTAAAAAAAATTTTTTTATKAGPNQVPGHKLGPKANTGAINAGLRALDRSGKPCRKWERKGLHIKSFTGMTWGMSSWRAPTRENGFSGDVKSDTASSSDMKPNESSAVGSERSHSHVDAGDTVMTNGIDHSPAPVTAS